MTDKKKVVKKYLRAKSLKITAGIDFVTTVINAAAYLTIHANDISSVDGQPSLPSMRASLMPAYELIAEVIGPHLGIELQPGRLTGLAVDLIPRMGTFTLYFSYKTDTGQLQPYNLHVSAQDSSNVFLRIRNKFGVDKAREFVDSI